MATDKLGAVGVGGVGDTLGTIRECWRKYHLLPENAADYLIDALLAARGALKEAIALAHRKTIRIDTEGDWICTECHGWWRYYDPPRHDADCKLAVMEKAVGFQPTGPDGVPLKEAP